MFKTIRDRNVWLILVATLFLGLAYGIAISVFAVFLDARDVSKQDIGTLAAWFAGGIVCFSLPAGVLIRRISAKAVLVLSLSGYACTVGAFPFVESYSGLAAIRFLDGACSVGIWVSSEIILLSRADRDNKAFLTSLYAIAVAVGYMLGPFAARGVAAVAPLEAVFLVSSVLSASVSLLVLARLDGDVKHVAHTGEIGDAKRPVVSALRMLLRIKTSCFANYAYGYFQASVVLFLPLFLMESKGIEPEQTILTPAFFAGGMLLCSNTLGRLGDRYGHLLLMRILGAIGAVTILAFVFLDSYAAMCGAVFIAGATLATISPVSLALQGVIVEPHEYSRSNSLYNLCYASGMLMGPPISSWLFQNHGGVAMLVHLAALWAFFVAFSILYARDDPAVASRTMSAN